MLRILLAAAAMWTGPASLAGAMRDDRSSGLDAMDYQSSLNQDATTTTTGDSSEICCVRQGGREITYPPGSMCPSTCVQRPEPGGCTVMGTRVVPPLPPSFGRSVDLPKYICCVCLLKEGSGKEEMTLPATSSCPQGCGKKGEGTRPGQAFHGQGDRPCQI
ncbi:unnamed protein product [Symbiodinium necroappetens]|uniref:Uncharacterized protein n=1 Tax=Symbiodinium necroappetens TaxID=1628268 RepID=A0A813C6C8_9DINO|nr:unnamed protein product [Symbiodinium necroappetens]